MCVSGNSEDESMLRSGISVKLRVRDHIKLRPSMELA